jgi:hypothetical protein
MGNGFKVKLMVDEFILAGVRVPGRRCTASLILCSWPSALICCQKSNQHQIDNWSLFSLKCTKFNTENCVFESRRGHRCLCLRVVSCLCDELITHPEEFTDCGVSDFDHEALTMWRPWPRATGEKLFI